MRPEFSTKSEVVFVIFVAFTSRLPSRQERHMDTSAQADPLTHVRAHMRTFPHARLGSICWCAHCRISGRDSRIRGRASRIHSKFRRHYCSRFRRRSCRKSRRQSLSLTLLSRRRQSLLETCGHRVCHVLFREGCKHYISSLSGSRAPHSADRALCSHCLTPASASLEQLARLLRKSDNDVSYGVSFFFYYVFLFKKISG